MRTISRLFLHFVVKHSFHAHIVAKFHNWIPFPPQLCDYIISGHHNVDRKIYYAINDAYRSSSDDALQLNRICGHRKWSRIPDRIDDWRGEGGASEQEEEVVGWIWIIFNYSLLLLLFTVSASIHRNHSFMGCGFRCSKYLIYSSSLAALLSSKKYQLYSVVSDTAKHKDLSSLRFL